MQSIHKNSVVDEDTYEVRAAMLKSGDICTTVRPGLGYHVDNQLVLWTVFCTVILTDKYSYRIRDSYLTSNNIRLYAVLRSLVYPPWKAVCASIDNHFFFRKSILTSMS